MSFLTRALGWGIAIYSVMYLVWSGLVIHGLALGMTSLVFRLVALAVVTTIAARSLQLVSRTDLLPFTLSWAAVAVVLDAIFLVPYSGWGLYSQWSVWFGYVLVAVIPLLTTFVPSLGGQSRRG